MEKTGTGRLQSVLKAGLLFKTGVYPKPKIVQRNCYTDVYLLSEKELQDKYLRFSAAGRFSTQALDRFYDEAGAGVYGDVEEGDWEAAGIRIDDSVHVRVSGSIFEPLKEEWNKVLSRWGIDEAEFVTRRGESHEEFEERFDENYDEILRDLHQERDLDKDAFIKALDEFVEKMME